MALLFAILICIGFSIGYIPAHQTCFIQILYIVRSIRHISVIFNVVAFFINYRYDFNDLSFIAYLILLDNIACFLIKRYEL